MVDLDKKLLGKYLLLLATSMLFFGCGYGFTVIKSLPCGVENIFVEMFENDTEVAGLESLFTDGLVKRLARHLPNGVVTSNVLADAVLSGVVISLFTESVSYNDGFQSCSSPDSMIRLAVVGKLSLKRCGPEGIEFWCSGRISETHNYVLIPSDREQSKRNRRKAIFATIEKLSESAFKILTEKF